MKKIKFFALYKEYNNGNMETIDVMPLLYNSILNANGTLSKKSFRIYDDKKHVYKSVSTKQELRKFIINHFLYHYWSKTEWEFIVSDWPPTNRPNRDKKIDVFQQLEPNIDLITNIVWEQIKDKIKHD